MKKEYFILIAVIIALSAYLVLKKDNQVNYELPNLPAITAQTIDRIEITREGETLLLATDPAAKPALWTITDQQFPADMPAVEKVLDAINDLSLSALVSESGDKVRYDLDTPNAIQVKAFSQKNLKREFTLGKTAPSMNHTFVMLAGDTRIFQANKNFRADFDKTLDELRDKVVLKFKSPDIKAFSLEKKGIQIRLTRQKQEPSEAESGAPAVIQWMKQDGTFADSTIVQNLLSSLSRLECQAFLPEIQREVLKKEDPQVKINLENEGGLGLNLFEQPEKEDVAGTASYTPYAFSLASYKAQDILSYVDQLLGIEKEETAADPE